MALSLLWGLLPVLLTATLYLLSLRNRFLARLYSPLSLCLCTALLLAVCLAMGLIRQDAGQNDGLAFLRNLKHSVLLIAVLSLFILVLGMFTLHCFHTDAKRLSNLIPAGIWITALSLLFGSQALERYEIQLWRNAAPAYLAYQRDGTEKHLPFALVLTDFKIDYHDPVIYLADSRNGQILPENRPQGFAIDSRQWENFLKGKAARPEKQIADCRIRILDYLPSAYLKEVDRQNVAVPSEQDGAVPAVRIEVEKEGAAQSDTAWIAGSSTLLLPTLFTVDSVRVLGLGQRQPAGYRAGLTIYEIKNDSGRTRQVCVRPNHPCRAGNFAIYLKSFKEEYGFWDPYVTLEVVKDPWQPATHTGILVLFIGLAGAWMQSLFRLRKDQTTTR